VVGAARRLAIETGRRRRAKKLEGVFMSPLPAVATDSSTALQLVILLWSLPQYENGPGEGVVGVMTAVAEQLQ
jgi:hypothetical protein